MNSIIMYMYIIHGTVIIHWLSVERLKPHMYKRFKTILALLLQEMISISIYACFQILLIFSLFIMLLYACNWIEVNKILFTLKQA